MALRVGSTPRYTDPAVMQEKVDEYFRWCDGEPVVDEDGKPMIDKRGNPIILGKHHPTVPGLALALGFRSRQTLLEYRARPAFTEIIDTAKLRIERYAAEMLYDRDGCRGAEFNLRVNYGWREASPDEEGRRSASGVVLLAPVMAAESPPEAADGEKAVE